MRQDIGRELRLVYVPKQANREVGETGAPRLINLRLGGKLKWIELQVRCFSKGVLRGFCHDNAEGAYPITIRPLSAGAGSCTSFASWLRIPSISFGSDYWQADCQ